MTRPERPGHPPDPPLAPGGQPWGPHYLVPCYRAVPGGPWEHCGRRPTRRYVNGWYCRDHAPGAASPAT